MVLACGLLLSSCYETKQEFTINPDGSGKVKHECSFQNVNLTGDSDAPEDALQAAISKLITDSKGIEAWRDVSFKRLSDGRLWFQGTAYFKKLADLEIPNQSMLEFAWKNQGGGKAQLDLSLQKSKDQAPAAKPAELSPAEKSEKLKADRASFQQSKPMMASILGTMKQSVTFHLPGKIDSSTNFKKTPAGSLDLVFEGSKMLAAMDKLVNDDAWIAKHGFDAKGAPDLDNEMSALLFGEKAPVRATVSAATKPLFDYAAEVTAAKRESAKLQKQLGTVSIAPPAKGEALKSLKVVGVRLVSAVDKKLDIRPFNGEQGYALSVLAELPGSVMTITDKSSIAKAVTIEGADLLKGTKDWDRRLGFPKLSADKAWVNFDVDLKSPPPETTGIKEISGTLQYRVASASKEVDLGLTSLKAGSKGTTLDASIESIKEGWAKDGSQDLELKVKLTLDELKSASLVVNGAKSEMKRTGYSSFGSTTSFTFTSKAKFPENAGIVFEIFDKVETFDVPFKLENLTLLGTPIKPDK